jgi:hypothetical protein
MINLFIRSRFKLFSVPKSNSNLLRQNGRKPNTLLAAVGVGVIGFERHKVTTHFCALQLYWFAGIY